MNATQKLAEGVQPRTFQHRNPPAHHGCGCSVQGATANAPFLCTSVCENLAQICATHVHILISADKKGPKVTASPNRSSQPCNPNHTVRATQHKCVPSCPPPQNSAPGDAGKNRVSWSCCQSHRSFNKRQIFYQGPLILERFPLADSPLALKIRTADLI